MTGKSTNILIGLVLFVVMVFWGGAFVAVKIALRYITPYQLIVGRFVPSLLMLLPLVFLMHRKSMGNLNLWSQLTKREKVLLVIAGFFAVPGYHLSINYGAMIIPAGWIGLVIALNPTCIAILASLMLKERIPLRRWMGITVSLAGLALIVLTQQIIGASGVAIPLEKKVLGILITLGGVLSWGGFTVVSKRLVANREPLVVLTWVIAFGTLMVVAGTDPKLAATTMAAPPELILSLLFVSLGATVFGFTVWYKVLKIWDASRAGVFIYLGPLVALAGGWLLLGESITLTTVVGALTVLGGVILASTATVKA